MKTRDFRKGRRFFRQAFLLAAIMLSIVACSTTSTTSSQAPQLMFVQIAEDLKVDATAKTLRLVNVNQQTLTFQIGQSESPGISKWPTISRNGQQKPARTILAQTHRMPRYPSMSRDKPRTRLS